MERKENAAVTGNNSVKDEMCKIERGKKFQNAYLLECLTAIYDQVPKSLSGADEFPDDHAHQAKADVHLHICKDQRDAGRKNDFRSSSFLPPPRVRISFRFSGFTSPKPVYRFRMQPKMATDIPATMMVRVWHPAIQ